METPLAVQESQPLTAAEVKAQVQRIQEIMAGVMQAGHHYGKIPGCGEKPALFKPGAEKLLLTFRIAIDPEAEDLSADGIVRYRVRSRATSASGQFLGTGLGECSSNEDKYAWREVVCNEEWKATPEDRRRIKWRKGKKDTSYSVQQVRRDPADVANTVLKMAEKRSNVNVVLKVTAASDIFTQDLEDDPDQHHQPQERPPMKRPQAKAQPKAASNGNGGEAPPNAITGPQAKRFYAIYKQAGKSDEEVKAYLRENYNITSSKQITRDIYEEICEWAEAPAEPQGDPDDIPY